MYHIVKTKSKKFQVVLIGDNGEVLSTSEHFTRKEKAFKNAHAQIDLVYEEKETDRLYGFVQDDTPTKSLRYKLYDNGNKVKTDVNPVDKYIPGKNPKKKK